MGRPKRGMGRSDSRASTVQEEQEETKEEKLDAKWAGIKRRALKIAEKDCAICYAPFSIRKDTDLLSCAHMFHSQCLESFERYDIAKTLTCPMCRTHYEKKTIRIAV